MSVPQVLFTMLPRDSNQNEIWYPRKARERELATAFDENRRAVGMNAEPYARLK